LRICERCHPPAHPDAVTGWVVDPALTG
jgi:hypothetical protein